MRSGFKAVLFQDVSHDIQVNVVGETGRRAARHGGRDFRIQRLEVLARINPRETLLFKRRASAAAQVWTMTAAARDVISRGAAASLSVGIHTIGDGAFLHFRSGQSHDHRNHRKDVGDHSSKSRLRWLEQL